VPNSPAVKVATAACTTGSDAQGLACEVAYEKPWTPDTGTLGENPRFEGSREFGIITGGKTRRGEVSVGNPL
jgi:hypothetical protein